MSAVKGKKDEPEKKPRRRIKKVAGHGGHHGGAWKVAYADFVTAMMALFLVLWLLSQADTKLKSAVANYFRTPGVFSSTQGGILNGPSTVSQDPSPDAATEEQMFEAVAKKLKERIADGADLAGFKDRVKIDVTNEGLRIQIIDRSDRVTFASGSAQLSAEAKVLLAEIAKAACQLPNSIAIGGHTDKASFPQGSAYTNWELSADRANAARRALEAGCLKPEQILRVIGYADTELAYPQQPYAAANRRINITLLRSPKQDEKSEKADFVEEKSDGKKSVKEKVSTKEAETKKEESAEKKSTTKSDDKSESVEEEPATKTKEAVRDKSEAAAKKSKSEAGEKPAKSAH